MPVDRDLTRLMVALLLSLLPVSGDALNSTWAQQPEVRARLNPGGTGRYVAGRWGTVKGTIYNDGDADRTVQLVVMPKGSRGLQFARKVTLPPQMYFESSWPVLVPEDAVGNIDLQYLLLPGGDDEGVIRRQMHDEVLSQVTGLVQTEGTGYSGWVPSRNLSSAQNLAVHDLMKATRFNAHRDQQLITVFPEEIRSHAACLDPVNQLAVTSDVLQQHPEACESIRLWMQRGGRLVLFIDQAGASAADLLLGEVLPLTVVGDVSTNSVKLTINPDYRTDRYPVREVVREFDEPIHYLRVATEVGEPIWYVDDWPVAMRVRFGEGAAVVTTISPEVFIVPRFRNSDTEAAHEGIASMRRIQETLFQPRGTGLLEQASTARQAAARIGYQIPARNFAAVLTLSFPLLLLCTGFWLLKRNAGEKLIWLLPLLAVVASIPAVAQGLRVRSVAPETVIQTQLVHALPGHTTLVSDGYVTTYNPTPEFLSLVANDGAVLEPHGEAATLDYRRLLWSDGNQNSWVNVRQPVGVSTFRARNVRRFPSPVDALATFDQNGLTGQLASADLTKIRDAILVGQTPEQMSVQLTSDGRFQSAAADVLASGQYFRSALLTDEQRQHAEVYAAVLSGKNQSEPFPEQPSLLFWADASGSAIRIGGDQARQLESLLVVVPLRMEAPAEGTSISIPSAFLPFRVLPSELGSYSTLFKVSERSWDVNGREAAGSIRLEFKLPTVCLPFEAEQARVHLKIRAGSRIVSVLSGRADDLKKVHELTSPVGAFDFDIPVAALQQTPREGSVFLQLEVSELTNQVDDQPDQGEQDDSWEIESLRLSMKGSRAANVP